MHVVFDFDRTLTVPRPGSQEDVTTWHIMNAHLPEDGQAQYQQLFEHYRALELAGTMTQEHAVTWWSSILDLFVDYKVNLHNVENDFLNKASIRPEAKEVFDFCETTGIPTVIMSAGIKDVIDIWARAYQIHPTVTLSTALEISPQGVITGWDRSSLVHALNKSELGHSELAKIRQARPFALIIGDGLSDADMAEGEESVLRIRLYDPRADEVAKRDAVRAETFRRFDLMVESGSLLPFRMLLQHLVEV